MYLRLVLEGIKRGLGVFCGKYKKNEDFATKIRGRLFFGKKGRSLFRIKNGDDFFQKRIKAKTFTLTNFYQNPKI